MSPLGTLLPSMAGAMLHLAPMTALVRCVCEIDGMAERQLWAGSVVGCRLGLRQLSDLLRRSRRIHRRIAGVILHIAVRWSLQGLSGGG